MTETSAVFSWVIGVPSIGILGWALRRLIKSHDQQHQDQLSRIKALETMGPDFCRAQENCRNGVMIRLEAGDTVMGQVAEALDKNRDQLAQIFSRSAKRDLLVTGAIVSLCESNGVDCGDVRKLHEDLKKTVFGGIADGPEGGKT